MSVELHLPDLPEVPVSLGGAGPTAARSGTAARTPWRIRLRDTLATYLPLLLMALLALGTWWLVKNVPAPRSALEPAPPRAEPDYTMSGFTLERFEPDGRLKLRLSGSQLRHFPDTDRIEVESLTLEAFAPDGRMVHATARRGLGNGDGSEIQLFGQARVTQTDPAGTPVVLTSDFLHLYTTSEKLHTHLPATLERGSAVLRSVGLSYDHARGLLAVGGPARLTLPPGAMAAKPAAQPRPTAPSGKGNAP